MLAGGRRILATDPITPIIGLFERDPVPYMSGSCSLIRSAPVNHALSTLAIGKFKTTGEQRTSSYSRTTTTSSRRRKLSGPGSSPPRCAWKCGRCTPCKPVHIPVPPGTPVTAEYYPEAWRCKCGNKLYMP
ncbi:EPIDERMAL PATTERNING FACTOR-like protein 6 [Cynara cardunculus var. scolymus]|uniref:EPIDERMAL PATTERNING FACTOR-like protein 6 n=1 Tax=Cynara cardunculus var. scolymus TaxID=59895 RepID=UPI000D62B952|nr:EPIDERMAL PATTERNING FACTOR-like protein 6 [Cynara cardunculus var. scolymus]